MTEEDTAKTEDRDESSTDDDGSTDASVDLDEGRLGEDIDGKERWKDDETVSDKATCPECGEPVHNLRMACPMCGHEYKDKEYDDQEAGTEFRAGAEVDEVGEAVKEGSGKEKTQQSSSESDSGDADE